MTFSWNAIGETRLDQRMLKLMADLNRSVRSGDYTFTDDLTVEGNLTVGGVVVFDVVTFADGDTTPSVGSGNVFVTANTTAKTITQFDDGASGQLIYIKLDANTTIENNSNIKLAGGADFVAAADDMISFVNISSVWYELPGSVK